MPIMTNDILRRAIGASNRTPEQMFPNSAIDSILQSIPLLQPAANVGIPATNALNADTMMNISDIIRATPPPPQVYNVPPPTDSSLLDKIADTLGITPKMSVSQEAAAGLPPNVDIPGMERSIGRQGALAALIALGSLFMPQLLPIAGAFGGAAMGRRTGLEDLIGAAEARTYARARERRAEEEAAMRKREAAMREREAAARASAQKIPNLGQRIVQLMMKASSVGLTEREADELNTLSNLYQPNVVDPLSAILGRQGIPISIGRGGPSSVEKFSGKYTKGKKTNKGMTIGSKAKKLTKEDLAKVNTLEEARNSGFEVYNSKSQGLIACIPGTNICKRIGR